MSKLLLGDGREYAVEKPFFTVGGASRYDLPLGESEALAFTLQKEGAGFWLIPGGTKLFRNGSRVGKPTRLESCDRLEWDGQVAVFLAGGAHAPVAAPTGVEEGVPSRYAKPLERFVGGREAALALEEILGVIAADTQAEVVYLLGESSGRDRWRRLAVKGDDDREKRTLRDIVSDTVLDAALLRHEPVFVESILGHPSYSQAESLIAAQIVSVACIPLVHRGQAVGAVYLASRTPTRPLRDEHFAAIASAARLAVLVERLRDDRARHGRSARSLPAETPRLLCREGKGPMQELLERLEKFSPTDLNLLVLGETGTGKELVAREIHRRSRRADGPFVAVNCGALPPSLIESILFGHGKGAFTGADRAQAGKLQLANGGTLFLDEIGDFPLELQVKILRAIQERQIEPIGSSQPIPVDFRIVAATHRDIDKMAEEGKFRSDLLYRIAGATVRVPALRERGDDAVFLANEFLKRVDPELVLSPGAEQRIRDYRWPGNVRELEQACLRAAALAQSGEVTEDDLELGRRIDASVGTDAPRLDGIANLREAQERFTREFVARALSRSGGSRSKAAAELGISERTLYRILAADGGGGDGVV